MLSMLSMAIFGLVVCNEDDNGKSKTIVLITDYHSTFPPNLVRVKQITMENDTHGVGHIRQSCAVLLYYSEVRPPICLKKLLKIAQYLVHIFSPKPT